MLKVLRIYLPIFPLALVVCVLTSMFTGYYGDVALEKDHLTQAKNLYIISLTFNPFSKTIYRNLKATEHLIADKTENDGETGVPDLAYSLPGKQVLGACVTVPVLMYHYVRVVENPKDDPKGVDLSVTPYDFNLQMDYLVEHGYHTISLDELGASMFYKAKLPSKPIVLTFDDGYRDFYTNAFPVLEEHNLQAVNFVITGFVDAPRYLTWDEIAEMEKSGLITFEAHTVNHASLPNISEASAKYELTTSKKDLEEHVGYPVNWMAYPGGTFDKDVANLTKKAGYYGAFTTQMGTCETKDTPFTEPRVRISGGDDLYSFANKLPWR